MPPVGAVGVSQGRKRPFELAPELAAFLCMLDGDRLALPEVDLCCLN